VQPTNVKTYQVVLTIILSIGFITLFAILETSTKFQEIWFGSQLKNYVTLTYIFDASVLILSIAMTFYT
jgi:hypothetical protein